MSVDFRAFSTNGLITILSTPDITAAFREGVMAELTSRGVQVVDTGEATEIIANLLLPPDMDAELDHHLRYLPVYMRPGLARYLRLGIRPGDFLCAVLANDLAEAVHRADPQNRAALSAYIEALDRAAPRDAWGSPDKVDGWVFAGKEAAARRDLDRIEGRAARFTE